MSTTDPVQDPIQDAFEKAKREFSRKLNSPKIYEDLLKINTIQEVYETTHSLQNSSAARGQLHGLGKIRRFLKCLNEYAAVIEIFVSVKPDILALIWGPIKLLLQWSSKMVEAFDRILDAMEKIGRALPQFALMGQLFATSEAVKTASVLFYKDMLEFFCITIKFFRNRRWELKDIFKTIWPGHQKEVDVVVQNINEHIALLKEGVTMLEIERAEKARIESVAQFEKIQSSQERENFLSLRARICPNLHDKRLGSLRNKTVPGCEKWLRADSGFCRWLDILQPLSSPWFWLQGIPGAGKTYLSATVIDLVRENCLVLFAFVSNEDKSSLTALAIMQCFIFQAAEDDRDFQHRLSESNEREITGNLEYTTELFQAFLKTAGVTYVVIDGLDEMPDFERRLLLERLDGVSKDCENIRYFISSRPEDDISKALDPKSTIVRVDKRNSGSIQNYVNYRSEKWMSSHKFDERTRAEATNQLSLISTIAKGMFLYARITLDYLEATSNIEEIQDELKALPEDLNEVYHRIFQKINRSRPQVRDRCKRVLGWLACAPTPLTTFEIEQALSINPNSTQRTEEIPVNFTNINFVQECGPIVEIVDEQLHFVHFTVPEYMFSKEVQNFAHRLEATESLTSTFLAYLCSVTLDRHLDDDEIQAHILSGRYRLLEYSSFYWPMLLNLLGPSGQAVERTNSLLIQLLEVGKNYEFVKNSDGLQPSYKNRSLQKDAPKAYDMVYATLKMRLDENHWVWNWSNSKSWAKFDPLVTSQVLTNVETQFEYLLRDTDFRPSIHFHYGSRPFKCTYPFCPHSRRGFESKKERDEHIQDHGRPWKCPLAGCFYNSIGFSSEKRRDEHWLMHAPTASQLEESGTDLNSLEPEEAHPLLFTFISENDVESVQRLLSCPGGKKLKREVLASARFIAAGRGSLIMTQLLAPPDEPFLPEKIVSSAMSSNDAKFISWAISKVDIRDCAKLIEPGLGIKSDELYSLWETHILDQFQGQSEPQGRNKLLKAWFKQQLFSKLKGNFLKESRLIMTLRKLHLSPSQLGSLLMTIARSSCSLLLAEEMLNLGAPIDYPDCDKKSGLTALRVAAQKTTKEAAFLMQFLIMRGARTFSNYEELDIALEPGAAQIAIHVGLTWDELREQYRQTHTNQSVID